MYESTLAHYRLQQQIVARVLRELRRQWAGIGIDFDLGWSSRWAGITDAITAGQAAAATTSAAYITDVLAEADFGEPVAPLVPRSVVGTTGLGRPIGEVARTAIIRAKDAVAAGATSTQALAAGAMWLETFAQYEIRKAGEDLSAAAIAATPKAVGYVRMLNPPSCKRCIILAGKWFRWNEGFDRHPNCDCVHVPARESTNELRTNPYDLFASMTRAEQDRIFGKNDAEAIRSGADMYRVVNVRARGLSTGNTWQARRYDTPSTMTVDEILKRGAGDRARTIDLLREHGFILPSGQVAGGGLLGNDGLGFWGAVGGGTMGRGGTRRGMTDDYRNAVRTGIRDPLSPATQTAAERRFHVAYLRYEAMLAGRNPFTPGRPLPDDAKALIIADWQRQLETLRAGHSGALAVARALGLI